MELILLSGECGGQCFNIRQVAGLSPGPLRVVIDSNGGCTTSALAIFHALLEHDGEVITEVIHAGSAAVLPALAGQRRMIRGDGYFFVHGAWGAVVGRLADMRAAVEIFEAQNLVYDSLIAERTGLSLGQAQKLSESESMIDAAEAVRLGFATEILGTPSPPRQTISLVATSLAAVRHEMSASQPAAQQLRHEALPTAKQGGRLEEVMEKRAKTKPHIQPGQAGEALEQFTEAERRQKEIFQQLESRLRKMVSLNGSIAWPARVAWHCKHCSQTNHHPPASKHLATPCAHCGATTTLEE